MRKIFATHTGGFLTSIGDNYTVYARYDFIGIEITQSFDAPKLFASIGEVKEYLRDY